MQIGIFTNILQGLRLVMSRALSLISTPVRALQQARAPPSIWMFSNSVSKSAAPLSQEGEDDAQTPPEPYARQEHADQQRHWVSVAVISKTFRSRTEKRFDPLKHEQIYLYLLGLF